MFDEFQKLVFKKFFILRFPTSWVVVFVTSAEKLKGFQTLVVLLLSTLCWKYVVRERFAEGSTKPTIYTGSQKQKYKNEIGLCFHNFVQSNYHPDRLPRRKRERNESVFAVWQSLLCAHRGPPNSQITV